MPSKQNWTRSTRCWRWTLAGGLAALASPVLTLAHPASGAQPPTAPGPLPAVPRPAATPATVSAPLAGAAPSAAAGAAPAAPTPAPEVEPPRLASEAIVAYPEGAAGNADVILLLVIGVDGTVTSATVASGKLPFAEVARAALLGWRFDPARRGGVPVADKIRFQIHFEEPASPSVGGAEDVIPALPDGTTPAAPQEEPHEPESEVVVTGVRKTGALTFTQAEVRQLPGALGDPLRSIEAFPGVTPTVSGVPYFYVRGAPPNNVGYFLDGMRLPGLFHVLAGPSVVQPGLIEVVDFHAGLAPIEFGRVSAGVVSASLEPPRYDWRGAAFVRAYDSSLLIEAPLPIGETSLTLGGRRSYANPVTHLFAPELSVTYWDYQARLSTSPAPGSRIELMAIGSFDQLIEDDGEVEREISGAEFHRIALSYQGRVGQGDIKAHGSIGWDHSSLERGQARVKDFSTRANLEGTYALSASVQLVAGATVGSDSFDSALNRVEDETRRLNLAERFPDRVEGMGSAYTAVRLRLGQWRVRPGARFEWYDTPDGALFSVSPRVSAEADLSRAVTLLTAVGLSDQPPTESLPQPGAMPTIDGGLQRAYHTSSGLLVRLPESTSLRLTVFQSLLDNLTDGPSISRLDTDDLTDDQSRSLGTSRGFELMLKRGLWHRLGGYLSYSLTSSLRYLGRSDGPALFDRRHVLSAAASYDFGAGVRAGLRGSFYTGVPADVAYRAAARNPPRTDPFYRVDVRGEKRWQLSSQGAYVAIVLEVLNTTLNQEILSESCNAYTCRSREIGPVTIPSLGFEASF